MTVTIKTESIEILKMISRNQNVKLKTAVFETDMEDAKIIFQEELLTHGNLRNLDFICEKIVSENIKEDVKEDIKKNIIDNNSTYEVKTKFEEILDL